MITLYTNRCVLPHTTTLQNTATYCTTIYPAGMTQVVEYDLPNGKPSPFPLVLCDDNIYVLPGVPHLLQQKWKVRVQTCSLAT